MKKEKIKNLLLIVIVALVTSFVTAYGVSSTFDSSNVCYKVDSSTGASVQDTIDDLYDRASDYSELNNRLSSVENHFTVTSDSELTTPSTIFRNDGIQVAKNSNSYGWIDIYNNGSIYGNLSASNSGLTIAGWNNNEGGQGPLRLLGNPVTINGYEVAKTVWLDCNSYVDYSNFGSGLTKCIRDNINKLPTSYPIIMTIRYSGERYGIGYVYSARSYANFNIINYNGETYNIRNNANAWSFKRVNDDSSYSTVN